MLLLGPNIGIFLGRMRHYIIIFLIFMYCTWYYFLCYCEIKFIYMIIDFLYYILEISIWWKWAIKLSLQTTTHVIAAARSSNLPIKAEIVNPCLDDESVKHVVTMSQLSFNARMSLNMFDDWAKCSRPFRSFVRELCNAHVFYFSTYQEYKEFNL